MYLHLYLLQLVVVCNSCPLGGCKPDASMIIYEGHDLCIDPSLYKIYWTQSCHKNIFHCHLHER